MTIAQKLETILFVASKPIAFKRLVKVLNVTEDEVHAALIELQTKYNPSTAGIVLMNNNEDWQLVSHPENGELAENFVKAEISGELTKAQLETLTVISYCGPITKPELEQLRGVNCSLILRNLMLRGLVEESETEGLLPTYTVTMEYVRHLGLTSVSELPDYAELHAHQHITTALTKTEPS